MEADKIAKLVLDYGFQAVFVGGAFVALWFFGRQIMRFAEQLIEEGRTLFHETRDCNRLNTEINRTNSETMRSMSETFRVVTETLMNIRDRAEHCEAHTQITIIAIDAFDELIEGHPKEKRLKEKIGEIRKVAEKLPRK